MVDRSQASQLTLGLPSRAKAGRGVPSANTPTSVPAAIPVYGPKSQPRLYSPRLPQPWRRHNRQRPSAAGFTLVELLIAVVIIGVLSGVAMPAFLGQQNKAKVNAANIQARGLMSYCLAYFIDNGKMPDSGDDEYQRLAKDPEHSFITWKAEREDSKCSVNIQGDNLSQAGIFSIYDSGDATKIQATPAKTKR